MTRKQTDELSMEIYHRIYRLTKKNVDPQRIAVTLSLPFRTVQKVVERLQAGLDAKNSGIPLPPSTASVEREEGSPYLDIYTMSRGRYAVLDLNGYLTEELAPRLEKELTALLKAPWKSIALLMRNIEEIDDTALQTILAFHKEYTRIGRYAAVLDPSPKVDAFLAQCGEAAGVDVFGTEKTFEERAFATTREIELRKKKATS